MVDTGPGQGDAPSLHPGVGVFLVQHHGGRHRGAVQVVQPGKSLTIGKRWEKFKKTIRTLGLTLSAVS